MASKAFEAAVRSIFAPRLEALGFTRKGIRYICPRPPWLIQALDIQQDKYNGSGFCRFTVNLTRMLGPGVTRAALLEHALARAVTRPSANTIRLGHLTEIREDHWYDYSPEDTAGIEAAIREALDDIERYGLFWLGWGLTKPWRGKDRSRAQAARARWDAYVASLQPEDHARTGAPE